MDKCHCSIKVAYVYKIVLRLQLIPTNAGLD
jgi:hypothetical protein